MVYNAFCVSCFSKIVIMVQDVGVFLNKKIVASIGVIRAYGAASAILTYSVL